MQVSLAAKGGSIIIIMTRKKKQGSSKAVKPVKGKKEKAKNSYNSKAIESIFGPPKKSWKKVNTNSIVKRKGPQDVQQHPSSSNKNKKNKSSKKANQQQIQLQQAMKKKSMSKNNFQQNQNKRNSFNHGNNRKQRPVNNAVRKFQLNLPDVNANDPLAPWWTNGRAATRNVRSPSNISNNNNRDSYYRILGCIAVNQESLHILDQELIEFAKYVRLTQQEIHSREYFIQTVQNVAHQIWPEVTANHCQVFGSYAAQPVCSFESDIDMAIWNVVPVPQHVNFLKQQQQQQQQQKRRVSTENEGNDDCETEWTNDNNSGEAKRAKKISSSYSMAHPNQSKQAKILKWKAALDAHLGEVNVPSDDKRKGGSGAQEKPQEQSIENGTCTSEDTKKPPVCEKGALSNEEEEKKKEEAESSCLFVIDRAGDANVHNAEGAMQQQQQQQQQQQDANTSSLYLDLTKTPTKLSTKHQQTLESVTRLDNVSSRRVSEDSCLPVPDEKDTLASIFEDSEVAVGGNSNASLTEREVVVEDSQLADSTQDNDDSEVEEEMDAQFQFENAEEEKDESVTDYNNNRDDDSDSTDSADKLEGLAKKEKQQQQQKRSRAFSCDSETRLLNLPDTDELCPPLPDYDEAEEVVIQGESNGNNEEEEEEEGGGVLINRPRSHSLISLSSSTTGGTREKEYGDFDSSEMEVSFVTMPTAAKSPPSAAAASCGPQGETKVLICRSLNLLQKRLRRKGSIIEQSHVRKHARIPIVNMLTCFGYEVDIALGGHNGADTSSYATSQIAKFER